MSKKINLNGKVLEKEKAIFGPENRAFRYGDSLFESMRIIEGRIPFLTQHYARLSLGLEYLGYTIPIHYSASFFEAEIRKLSQGKGNHRLRLSVFREDGGLYTPKGNAPVFCLEISPISQSRFELNSQGLHLGLYQEYALSFNLVSRFKTGNALPYILAAKYKQAQGFDDCVLCSKEGLIAETISSNIFLIKQGEIATPDLISGCVGGVLRRCLLDTYGGIKLLKLTEADLLAADEVFLTNAVQGIRWVTRYKNKKYVCKEIPKLLKHINKKADD